jgi:Uri superfamily endonuclease
MQAQNNFPSTPGSYVIILDLKQKQSVSIGRLGKCEFPTGRYAYVGSAQGSGGLAGRIRRHLNLSHAKQPHWHIDYLNLLAQITQTWWEVGTPGRECEWAQILSTIGKRIISGFGSSDCRCPGHLIWFSQDQKRYWLECMKSISKDLGNMEFLPSQE